MGYELIITSIIAGITTIISIVVLHLSWKSKLRLTLEAEERKLQTQQLIYDKEIKIAKIKSPRPKFTRMPRNYKDQLSDLISLLNNEQVQDIIETLSDKKDDIAGNKLIETLLPMAQNFLRGMNDQRAEQEQITQTRFE